MFCVAPSAAPYLISADHGIGPHGPLRCVEKRDPRLAKGLSKGWIESGNFHHHKGLLKVVPHPYHRLCVLLVGLWRQPNPHYHHGIHTRI